MPKTLGLAWSPAALKLVIAPLKLVEYVDEQNTLQPHPIHFDPFLRSAGCLLHFQQHQWGLCPNFLPRDLFHGLQKRKHLPR